LSENSHTAGSAFAQGLVDELVPATDVHAYLARALKLLRGAVAKEPVTEPTSAGIPGPGDEPWNIVQAARAADRPAGEQLIREACDELVELRGDRQGIDDPALFAALARIAGRRVLILALDPEHFPGPGAFRKAKRCLLVAERIGFPVATVVDTRGADPSEDSEAGGIAWEISSLFEAMLRAEVPILCVVTGEGGSGGALAFATGDLLVAYADSIFSVIGPEGAAEILWRDGNKAPQAAALLKLTAHDLVRLGIADAVTDATLGPESLRDLVAYHLDRLTEGRTGDRDWSRARRTRWRNLSGH
jgi:acetyl-CoA carboxylase carboxyl transferase subunit beta